MQMLEHFEGVDTSDETGIVEGTTFGFVKHPHDIYKGENFSICELGGARVAVFFVEGPLPPARRAQIAAARPDRIGTIMFAEVPKGSEPMIEAEVRTPGADRYTAYGFAAAVAARNHGAFDIERTSCVVRFPSATVAVSIDFDGDSESFFGTATLEPASR